MKRTRIGLVAVSFLVVTSLSACSSPSPKSLAAQACEDLTNIRNGVVIGVNGDDVKQTIGEATAGWNKDVALLASASAADSRWAPLMKAAATGANVWRDIGHAVGMKVTSIESQWTPAQREQAYRAVPYWTNSAAASNNSIITTQCQIAISK